MWKKKALPCVAFFAQEGWALSKIWPIVTCRKEGEIIVNGCLLCLGENELPNYLLLCFPESRRSRNSTLNLLNLSGEVSNSVAENFWACVGITISSFGRIRDHWFRTLSFFGLEVNQYFLGRISESFLSFGLLDNCNALIQGQRSLGALFITFFFFRKFPV